MPVPLRPLTRVERVIKALGLEITYAYDDIVFAEHSAFILQFGETGEKVYLYFNNESEKDKRGEIESELIIAGQKEELEITNKGTFTLEQLEGEQIKLTLHNQ